MAVAGIYRHFKGSYYEVLGIAIDEASGEELILYRQMYDVFGYWMRPKNMFLGEKMTENGLILRFKPIGVSYENILASEDVYSISIGHSETQQRYHVVGVKTEGEDKVFTVKLSE